MSELVLAWDFRIGFFVGNYHLHPLRCTCFCTSIVAIPEHFVVCEAIFAAGTPRHECAASCVGLLAVFKCRGF